MSKRLVASQVKVCLLVTYVLCSEIYLLTDYFTNQFMEKIMAASKKVDCLPGSCALQYGRSPDVSEVLLEDRHFLIYSLTF